MNLIQIDAEIKRLSQLKEGIKSRRKWSCPKCNSQTCISKLDFIIKKYWDRSYDDWSTSTDYFIHCPKCGNTLRYYTGGEFVKYAEWKRGLGGTVFYYECNGRLEFNLEGSIQFKNTDRKVLETLVNTRQWTNA